MSSVSKVENTKKLKKPVCDVVVVNYNAGAYLARCVASIFQSDVPINLIIVDNASVDDSLEKIEQLDAGKHQLRIIYNSENLGFARAVNIGAKVGESSNLMLLNPDCEIHPHSLRKLIKSANTFDDFGVMGALVFNEDGTEQRGCRRLEPTFTRSVVTALRLGKYFQSVNLQGDKLPTAPMSLDAVSGSAMLIDRATFERVNGMDEGYFLHVEDLDFCRRVREAGKRIYFTPEVSIFHHHGASSHALPVRTEWHKHQGMLRYQEKFQKPNQNAIRSLLTRGVIYLHFGLSMLRKSIQGKPSGVPLIQSLMHTGEKPLIITGASSDLGNAVLHELKNEQAVIAVSRQSKKRQPIGNEVWMNWSFFEKVPVDDFKGGRAWLAVSPIWTAAQMATTLARFGKLSRAVAVSSTSVIAKANSENAKERDVVQRLIDGERSLIDWAKAAQTEVTICRASMVYGGAKNNNIAFIKKVIRYLRFFPMLSMGKGMRQPVHIQDLSAALLSVLKSGGLAQDTYILAGGEQLSYKQMVERVFTSMNQTPKFKTMPASLLMRAADFLSGIPGLRFLNREMVMRMEADMVYDIEPAKRDFGYAPEKFRP